MYVRVLQICMIRFNIYHLTYTIYTLKKSGSSADMDDHYVTENDFVDVVSVTTSPGGHFFM